MTSKFIMKYFWQIDLIKKLFDLYRYLTTDKHNLDITAQLIYFFFLVLVSLILMNLLIGLAVNDIQGLQKEGRIKRLRKQAEFIVYLEDMTTNRFLLWLFCCAGIKGRLNSWLNLEPVYTFSPGSRRGRKSKVALPSNTVERAVAIVQEGRVPLESIAANETFNLLQECVNSIGLLRQRIESLEIGLVGNLIPPSAEEPGSSDNLDMAASDEQNLLSDQQEEESDGSTDQFELDIPKRHGKLFDGEDQIDGIHRAVSRTPSRKTTKTMLKRSIQSELQDIRRILSSMASNRDHAES